MGGERRSGRRQGHGTMKRAVITTTVGVTLVLVGWWGQTVRMVFLAPTLWVAVCLAAMVVGVPVNMWNWAVRPGGRASLGQGLVAQALVRAVTVGDLSVNARAVAWAMAGVVGCVWLAFAPWWWWASMWGVGVAVLAGQVIGVTLVVARGR